MNDGGEEDANEAAGNVREKRKLENETTKVEGDITNVECELSSVNKYIQDKEGRIQSIEETIRLVQQQLDDEPTDALRKIFKSLQGDKETFLNEIKDLLREKEILLCRKEERLNKKATTSLEQSADPSTSQPIINFKFEQRSASTFTAGKSKHCSFCLYNGDTPVTFNRPEIIRSFFLLEVEDETKISAKATITEGLPRSIFPEKVSETHSGTSADFKPTIQQEAGVALNNFFSIAGDGPKIICSSRMSLESVQSSFGPATENSSPDGLAWVSIAGKRVPLGCFELKDSAFAPIEQTGQAFASGANLALSQVRVGLESSEVAVPLLMTNGHLYQFGMATLLDYIPVLHLLTNVLDASDPSAIDKIAKFLALFRNFMKTQAMKLLLAQELPVFKDSESTHFSFDKSKYHLKSSSRIFNRFSPIAVERQALPLLWDVFDALAGLDEVMKPLGYGELKGIEESGEGGCLVFYNLCREGFVMGVPFDEEPYNTFCKALNILIRKIHARGVIHVDLYPSNILWLCEDGKIKIRVIDWDAATFKGETYPNSMKLRFDKSTQQYYVTEPVAKPENDAWHVFILSSLNLSQRISLQGTGDSEASKVNSAYQQCISDKVKEAGGLEKLHDQFVSWFSDHFKPLLDEEKA